MNVNIPDAALWGAAGGLISSVFVLLLGRALRHRGKLRAHFSDWTFHYHERARGELPRRYPDSFIIDEETGEELPIPVIQGPGIPSKRRRRRRLEEGPKRADYSFTADLFNEKDIDIALREVRVVFLLNGRQKISAQPFDLTADCGRIDLPQSALVSQSALQQVSFLFLLKC